MKVRKVLPAILLVAVVFFAVPSNAFNQPPMNLGLTDILDGALPGPGTYFTQYIQGFQSDEFKDSNGNNIPNQPRIGSLLMMNQFVHVYKHKLAGGHIGADVLLPIVSISGNGIPTNPGLLGDLTVGPFLQWFDHKLLGRPFLHRFEFDVSMPTGQYDKAYSLNPGSNLWVIEPYYAFTWFITPEFSTSWRIHYTYSTENDDTKVQPGDAFHFNYSFEYALRKDFRVALAGYYLKQLSEDEVNGNSVADSEEQVFGFGPAVHWIVNQNFSMGLKTAFETGTENRPEGSRTTFRWTYKF
jgi:anthranilate 1,2-dioxygenase (deaminating, decarboxylating) large subunit